MTRERREEVVLVALVASVAIHIALMLLVRSEVMTRPASGIAKPPHREPMRIVNRAQRPDPAKIEEILDLEPVKDAPPVREERKVPGAECLVPGVPQASPKNVESPEKAVSEQVAPEIAPVKFEVRPVGLDAPKPAEPAARIETPKMTRPPAAAPEFAVSVPTGSTRRRWTTFRPGASTRP